MASKKSSARATIGSTRWCITLAISSLGFLLLLVSAITLLSLTNVIVAPTMFTGTPGDWRPPPNGAWERVQDDVVIIVKTGAEVADARMPRIQRYGMLNTPGRIIPNMVKVATDPDENHGIYGIRDLAEQMLTNSSQEAKDALFSKTGWAGDIYKNFPALKLAHTLYPNKAMYIHADDDTFFVLDALAEHVERYKEYQRNGTKVLEGRIFTLRSCKHEDDEPLGPGFAHGGSGVFFSEPGIRALMDVVDKCFERYIRCWAGDGAISLCAKQNGITVRKFPGLLGGTMTKNFFPLEKRLLKMPDYHPVTYHKLAPIEQAALSDLVNLRLEQGLGPPTALEIRDHLVELKLTQHIDLTYEVQDQQLDDKKKSSSTKVTK